MRNNNREQILEAAARVVQRKGIASLKFDAVALESGFTRGGLLYHFHSREELILAVHEFMAARWEASMAASAGLSAEEATDAERNAAYARVNSSGASRAEMLFIIEGSTNDAHAAPWEAAKMRWAPPTPAAGATEAELTRFLARLAADGLYMFEVLSSETLDPEVRHILAEKIAAAITDGN